MPLSDLVIHSQLIPPRPRKDILPRPRVQAGLVEALDFPLTLVLAGTGYGKSTALAQLAQSIKPCFWYGISESERDPLLFLVHLISAFQLEGEMLGAGSLRFLEDNGGWAVPGALTPLMNALTNQLSADALLVLDDYHLVQHIPEVNALVRQLMQYRPPRLHLIISTRRMPEDLDLPRWRTRGLLNSITYQDLAFTSAEVEALLAGQHGYPISMQQAERLAEETEGWGIAIQLVWQRLQRESGLALDKVLEKLPDNLEGLFDYLALEVLTRQPEDLQQFMLAASVLRRLDAPACDALLETSGSQAMLRRLHEGGLFLEIIGGESYRFQRLFQDFLRARLASDALYERVLHQRAAAYFERTGIFEETVHHFLQAGEPDRAAGVILKFGEQMLRTGRVNSLRYWINRLPAELRTQQPGLDLLLGDALRLQAEFDPALAHYTAAGEVFIKRGDHWGHAQALRGQAQVYLDTIRPLKADALLEEALRLLEPQEHRQEVAALLDQLAENKLNLGQPQLWQSLHREAGLLRTETSPNDRYLEARALLRTGRLHAARETLETLASEERTTGQLRPQRFHRETLVLLSLVDVMLGDAASAEACAREGIEIGRQLQSDFVEAVGMMRLGNALQVEDFQPWDESRRVEALHCYQRSIEQVRPFKVARVGVEPLWGLCRLCGYNGDLKTAEEYALRALEISTPAGDEWIGDLVRTSMGASLALAGRWSSSMPTTGRSQGAVDALSEPAADPASSAEAWLTRAAEGFQQVGDHFGWCAATLWRSLNAFWQSDQSKALTLLDAVLKTALEHNCEALLERSSQIGMKNVQHLLPLLLAARRAGLQPELVTRFLRHHGAADLDSHPGYPLWVRTLGPFSVWRGSDWVTPQDWQRDKARQLFQLLVTFRGQWLLRDQMVELLWPDLPADAAVRDFKVALNALNRALEPQRGRAAQPFFVIRNDNLYGLNPAASICVDADEFEQLIPTEDCRNDVQERQIRRALAWYEEDYLPECRYEDWAQAERERLRGMYLTAAGRLAALLAGRQAWDEVIPVVNTALARDRCWEQGYRLLMQAYASKGSLAQVQGAYRRCLDALEDEIGVEPSAETRELWQRLLKSNP